MNILWYIKKHINILLNSVRQTQCHHLQHCFLDVLVNILERFSCFTAALLHARLHGRPPASSFGVGAYKASYWHKNQGKRLMNASDFVKDEGFGKVGGFLI